MLADGNTAQDTIKTLASMQLKDIKRRIDGALENGKLDTYSAAHLNDAQHLISKALDANYVYNMPKSFGGVGGGPFITFGAEAAVQPQPTVEPTVPVVVPQQPTSIPETDRP